LNIENVVLGYAQYVVAAAWKIQAAMLLLTVNTM
jgi:hypothetical protein